MQTEYSMLSLLVYFSCIFKWYFVCIKPFFLISSVFIYLFISLFIFSVLLTPDPTPQIFGTTVQIRSLFVYRLACELAKISDAFRSYLNVFDDEVGKYFQLNSVTVCISISENSIVDSTY